MARGPRRDGWNGERSAAPPGSNPWIIASVVSLATFMEVLDTSIANVALRHIAGGLAASYDEATWVLTSYLIANAITVPITGWMSEAIGRKRYYMICVAGFAAASLVCGLAGNLTMLVLARIVQGLAGGGLQPTTQSILVDTFPPERRGSAIALFGLTAILAPTIGPTLGGYITDHASWHWIFLINVPVGIFALVMVQVLIVEPPALQAERRAFLARGLHLDVVGFALIALGLGSLEYTMDRGQRLDWFHSQTIWITAVIAGVCLVGFVIWELCVEEPLLDLRLFKNRNYAISNVLIMIVGVILFGTTQFLPQFLQEVMGYTATQAGLAMTVGGFVTILVMPIAGLLSNRVQPRWLMSVAMVVEIYAMYRQTTLNSSIPFIYAAEMRLWVAVALPLLFVPITNAAYVGLRPDQTGQASAMLNVFRNLGGTFGISLVQTFLAQRQQFHQARLVEHLHPLNANFNQALARIAQVLHSQGIPQAAARQAALRQLYSGVTTQAAVLSYVEVFWVLTVFMVCVTPLVFFLKASPAQGGGGGGAG
jgi:DHA2 family multidrug resistance protein